jgi:triosephosphate isomerase
MKKRVPFIAGNWKMHMTIPEARDLAGAIVKASPDFGEAEVVVVPPFTALREVKRVLEGGSVRLGAQDVFWEDKGAFTGKISAPMLRDAGCQYVLIGHSERRQFFGETDTSVNMKIQAALRHGLIPIVCIGETLEEREQNKTMIRVDGQLLEGLANLSLEAVAKAVFAYEPVWAIGTGKTATPGQAEEVHAYIRERLAKKVGNESASCAIILYGGSVKPSNAYSLAREENIDGFLVGGASLEASSFIQISKEALRAYKERN